MCGIGGIYNTNTNKGIENKLIDELFIAIESRGKHACGASWTWQNSDAHIQVFKQPTAASTLVNQQFSKLRVGELINYILLHTRYATKGSKYNNHNNHPIVSGNIVMTHNGWLTNDEELWDSIMIERKGEVDSEALCALIHEQGVEKAYALINGPAAIAWVDVDRPKQVNLLTNGQNPLHIGRLENGNIVWASLREHLEILPTTTIWEAIPYRIYTLNPCGNINKTDISTTLDYWL